MVSFLAHCGFLMIHGWLVFENSQEDMPVGQREVDTPMKKWNRFVG